MTQQHSQQPLIAVAFGARIIGMNAHTGQRVWEFLVEGWPDRLWVEDGRVFTLGRDVLYCLEFASGTLLWQVEVPVGTAQATLLAYAGVVIVAREGEVSSFAADTGALLWHEPFKGYGHGHVAIAAPGLAAQADRVRP